MTIDIGSIMTKFIGPGTTFVREKLTTFVPLPPDLVLVAAAAIVAFFLSEKIITRFAVWLMLTAGLFLLLRFV